MARYHGKSGRLYASVSGTTAAIPVASLSSWSVDLSTDKEEVTSFGDLNKTYVQGLPDISGDFEGFWDDTDNTVFTGAASADGIKLYLYPSLNAATRYWYGPAWLDYSIENPVDGATTISGSFSANGSWGRN